MLREFQAVVCQTRTWACRGEGLHPAGERVLRIPSAGMHPRQIDLHFRDPAPARAPCAGGYREIDVTPDAIDVRPVVFELLRGKAAGVHAVTEEDFVDESKRVCTGQPE